MKTIFTIALLALSLNLAADSLYCPQNHSIINVGMTTDQVMAACGQPLSTQDSNVPATQKVPVTQFIYTNAGTSTGANTFLNRPDNTAFYGYWNIPLGTQGSQLEIDVMNNKIVSIRINGSGSNATSLCGGSIQVGDPASKAYFGCGTPSTVNNTFINQVLPGAPRPQVWIYQMSPYQPPVTLTFVNGKLQSID